MACSIDKIKTDSLAHVRSVIQGKAKSIKMKDTYAQFTYGPEYKIKTLEQAVIAAQKKQVKIEAWAEKKFGPAFKLGWTSLKTSPTTVNLDFTFPDKLKRGYERKFAKEIKAEENQKLIDHKQNTASEFVYDGEIYSSLEDMQAAIDRDSDFLPNNTDFTNTNFVDYINSKRGLLDKIERRLSNLKADRRFNKTKELVKEIKRVETMGQNLAAEIHDLMITKNPFEETMKVFQRDFNLVDNLLVDKKPSIENINAAEHILSYFKLITDYNNSDNHFIPNGDINNINPLLKAELDKIHIQTLNAANRIDSVKQQYLLDVIERSKLLNQMYPSKEAEEIRKILLKEQDDIDVLSQFFLTVDKQFTKTDSLLAQVIRQELEGARANNKAQAAEFIEAINAYTPAVMKKLIAMGYGVSGSKLINNVFGAVNYSLFYQKTPNGQKNGRLIHKFSTNWFKQLSNFNTNHNDAYWSAIKGKDWDAMDQSLRNKYEWLNNNADFFDISRIPEIASDPVFSNWSRQFDNDAAAQAYKAEIIGRVGEYTYNKMVEEQKEKLEDYRVSMENHLQLALDTNNVGTFAELPVNVQHSINITMVRNSPFNMIDSHKRGQEGRVDYSYSKNNGAQFQSHILYNTYFPKQETTSPISGETTDSGFYDSDFATIEQDKDLLGFWETLSESTDYMNSVMNNGTNMVAQGSLPNVKRLPGEILLDKNMNGMQKTILLFDSTKQFLKDLFSASGRHMDNMDMSEEINAGNLESIQPDITRKSKLEEFKLQRIIGSAITNKTIIDIDKAPDAVKIYFSELTGIPPNELGKKFDNRLQAKKVIREYDADDIMSEQSFNLPVAMRAFLDMTAEYKSQKDAQPKISIFKDMYENINLAKNEDGNGKVDAAIVNVNNRINRKKKEKGIENRRVRANTRMNHWYNKNVLNTANKEMWLNISSITNLRNYDKLEREYKREAEKQLKYINEKLAKDDITDKAKTRLETEKKEIQDTINNIGKDFTVAAAYNTVVNRFSILLGLGWNVPSQIVNRFQGMYVGILNDTGKYWTRNNFLAANAFINKKGLRYLPGQKKYKNEIKKVKLLIDKLQIIQDATNELDRARSESGVRGLAKKIGPFYLTEYTEWHNQTPQILAMLMDERITDNNGNTVAMFDGNSLPAFNIVDGKLVLKDAFKNEANEAMWEKFSTPEFATMKSKMSDTISILNGDYSRTGSTYAKASMVGKTVMTFKTWLPNALWQRFAYNQQSLTLGKERYDGIYTGAFTTSKTGSATSVLLAGGMLAAGVMGLGVGLGVGMAVGTIAAGYYMAKKNAIDNSDLKIAAQLSGAGKALVMKLIGLPVNVLAGKEVVPEYTFKDLDITDAEKQNLMSIVNETGVLLGLTLAKVIMKGMFANNDEEEPEFIDGIPNPNYDADKIKSDTEKGFYNLMENQLTRLISDITLYTNPKELFNTVSSTSIHQWFTKVERINDAITKYNQGLDTITSGPETGKSRLGLAAQKAFLPKIMHGWDGAKSLGFKNMMDREWNNKEEMDHWFLSDYKAHRKVRRMERSVFKSEQTEYWQKEFDYSEMDATEQKAFDDIIEKLVNKEMEIEMPYLGRADFDENQDSTD